VQFHHRKGHAGSPGFVPGGLTTWFAENLSTLPRVQVEAGGILGPGISPAVS
jgi:hypothetical protein